MKHLLILQRSIVIFVLYGIKRSTSSEIAGNFFFIHRFLKYMWVNKIIDFQKRIFDHNNKNWKMKVVFWIERKSFKLYREFNSFKTICTFIKLMEKWNKFSTQCHDQQWKNWPKKYSKFSFSYWRCMLLDWLFLIVPQNSKSALKKKIFFCLSVN